MTLPADTASLLAAVRGGSAEAFDSLFARYGPRLLALVRLRLGPRLRDRLESRDIAQAALLKAFRGLDRFEGASGAALMAWLVRIAENEIRDQADFHGRERRDVAQQVAWEDVSEDLPSRGASPSSQLLRDERMERVAQALETLEPQHREVIVGRFLEELSFQDLSKRLGRSPDACRMLLVRALSALTVRMGGAA